MLKLLDDLIDEVQREGFIINNLSQHDNGTWQANLRAAIRDGSGPIYHVAYGNTHIKALRRALKTAIAEYKAERKRKSKTRKRVRL